MLIRLAFLSPFPTPARQYPCQVRKIRSPSLCATAPVASPTIPDAGLIEKSGVTGTTCANLWPIPVFGAYSWFLNVYERRVAAEIGSFVVEAGPNSESLTLSFSPSDKPATSNSSEKHRSFFGVATGNINVTRALKELANPASPYLLKFFEKGGAELFFQRRNEVHLCNSTKGEYDDKALWQSGAPKFCVTSRFSAFEVREVYGASETSPARSSKFEYFGMNLLPIFPFQAYSCFVCVWKQNESTCPVAIDKRGKSLRLSFVDPEEIAQPFVPDEAQSKIGTFAVREFYGAVTDAIATEQHRSLLRSIAASSSLTALSDTDFRVVMDNTKGTFAAKRRNEIWIPVLS